jgi:arabinosaccharide transport system substrate-binding protein
MVQARFAPYTSRGHVYGLPHDVHPVMLAYRRDLLEKDGVDVRKIVTWDDFVAVGRRLTRPPDRYMIELSDAGAGMLETLLFQRDGGYFDPHGRCILDNETAVETMKWYVPLVAGPNRIGNDISGGQILTKAVEEGYILCMVTPDWRSKSIEQDIPKVSGRMALMPLPAVRRGGRRTSTWGGTMIGITRRSRHKDLAWQLALHLYLDKPQLAERFRETNILPCMMDAWKQPSFTEPRPYWSDQPLGALYADLAPDVPFQYTSPFIRPAKAKLSEALVACVQYYRANGDRGFDPYCRQALRRSADQVRRLIARNPY